MRFLRLGSLSFGGALVFFFGYLSSLAAGQVPATRVAAEDNVNTRYTVESIEISGDVKPVSFSSSLRENIQSLVGERFNPDQLQELARQIRKELRLKSVTPRLVRGSTSDQVRVVFEMTRRSIQFDVSVPKFLYHSKQGWSAQVEASTTAAHNSFTFGIVSDGDELTERFAGIVARYENLHAGSDRVHLGFRFESYHEQWNRATLLAIDRPYAFDSGTTVPGIYRTRQNYEPVATFVISKPLSITVGASFEQMGLQNGGTQSANAMLGSIRYHRVGEPSPEGRQDIDAAYSLRAASRDFGSDFSYTRHQFVARYAIARGRNTVSDEISAGFIAGQAPLFERFVLGTSSLLRGWNRYEIDPLGGNRMLHNSIEYGCRMAEGVGQIFYDAGTLSSRGQSATIRHSLGVGYRQGIFSVALAFPLREGRIDPIVMVGMNY